MKYKHFSHHAKKTNASLAKSKKKSSPMVFFILVIVLSVFGLVMIMNVSALSALADFSDRYYYVAEQTRWLALGLGSLVFFSFFDYRRLYALALPGLVGSLAVLIAVFIPGIGVRVFGASRWINLGFINLQPTEFVKLALIIYLSSWFTYKERKRFISFLILLCLVVAPVVAQPDLGSAAVIAAIAVAMYFLSGAPLYHFLFLLPFGLGAGAVLAIAAPYRLARVVTFFNHTFDSQGSSYHVQQILVALGSGGLFGLGLGQSRQKYAYLPETTTDSIFAIIGEELGFIGATTMLILFVTLIMQGVKIAQSSSDRFGELLASGIVAAFAIQILINLGAMVAIIPLTGIPLPFISYGGSNLIVSFTMAGILINIARQS